METLKDGITFYSARDIDLFDRRDVERDERTDTLQTTLWWLRGYVMQPSPFTGFPRCPYVKAGLESGAVRLAVERLDGRRSLLEERLECYRLAFENLPLIQGVDRVLHGIVISFLDLAEGDFCLLDQVQSKLKGTFVSKGLMLGQFHARCDQGSIHSDEVLALRSPSPILAIRQMMASDLVFLDQQAAFFRAYQRYISADKVPHMLLDRYNTAEQRFKLS